MEPEEEKSNFTTEETGVIASTISEFEVIVEDPLEVADLPPPTKEYTLVLDLDETLIHSHE